MGGLLQEVHDDDTNNFNHEKFDIKAKDGILYTYIIKKLNKTLRGLVNGTKSGFEVFRLVVREQDPITGTTKHGLMFQYQEKAYNKCNHLEATRNLVQDLDRRIEEYREKTGCETPADVKVTVLHKAMDDNTAQFARVSGKVSMDSYTDLKSYVEEQYQIELGRKIDT